MEVEIEDLHLQIDDIAKAKTAVRMRGVPGQIREELRENGAVTVAAFTPNRAHSPARSLHARAFCGESGPPLLCLSPLRAEAWEGMRWKREPARAHLPV